MEYSKGGLPKILNVQGGQPTLTETAQLCDHVGHTHGLLGQTVRYIKYENKLPEEQFIEGTVDEYRIEGNDIFGTQFKYTQFL